MLPCYCPTLLVSGNCNEHGLIIGETTFGGLSQLDGHGTGAIIDYGSLIWITLQRARNAREAIRTMDELVQEYGYASDGESFSIADPEEVWLMEMIGKGKTKGAVWVANRVPEGFIGCANRLMWCYLSIYVVLYRYNVPCLSVVYNVL